MIHTRALSLVTYQLRDRARSRLLGAASESTAQEVLLTRSTRRAAAALGIAETYEPSSRLIAYARATDLIRSTGDIDRVTHAAFLTRLA